MLLLPTLCEKPWGQIGIPHLDKPEENRRIGEVSFSHPRGEELPVMIKYLYTTERLSIQVHPDNEQARARGHACGKDEMWIVLDAKPDSTIGLGLKREVTEGELRDAMLTGSIEELVDWRPVARGDVIYNSAGTIHAAGAGLVLLEVQQSIDLTYRLYDYGRPRQLHLEEGLSVAKGAPHAGDRDGILPESGGAILVDGPHFGVAWCSGAVPMNVPVADHYQLAVIEGIARINGSAIRAGECGLAGKLDSIAFDHGTVAALAWPSAKVEVQQLARAA